MKAAALVSLIAKYAPELLKRTRPDTHRLKSTIRCRIEDDEHEALIIAIHDDGYKTIQDWLIAMIHRYLTEKQLKKERN